MNATGITKLKFVILATALIPAICGQQRQAYRAPRLPGTQYPDLNGIWEVLNTANWNLEPHAAGPSPCPRHWEP